MGILFDRELKHFDDNKNLVELTGREHFVAHWLLHRAFPKNRNLAAAFHAMATMANAHHFRYTPSSRAVQEARRAYAVLQMLPVAMYSLNGELIRVFKTTEEASNEIGTSRSNISAACNEENYVNNIKGYQWRRFQGNPKKSIEPYINQNKESSKSIHEYDLDGNFIRTHKSIREAARHGINRSAFKKATRELPLFAKDKWFIVSSQPPLKKIIAKKRTTQRRKVNQIHPESGKLIKIWDSTRQIQRELGISNVSSVCNGKRKTMGGYIWKYAEQEYELNLEDHRTKLARALEISVYKNGRHLGDFASIRKAEAQTGIKRKILTELLKDGKTLDGISVSENKSNS